MAGLVYGSWIRLFGRMHYSQAAFFRITAPCFGFPPNLTAAKIEAAPNRSLLIPNTLLALGIPPPGRRIRNSTTHV
jgi:hypothetical protein